MRFQDEFNLEDFKEGMTDYYIKSVDEYNALAQRIRADKDWYEDFKALLAHYYEKFCTGGNLHKGI